MNIFDKKNINKDLKADDPKSVVSHTSTTTLENVYKIRHKPCKVQIEKLKCRPAPVKLPPLPYQPPPRMMNISSTEQQRQRCRQAVRDGQCVEMFLPKEFRLLTRRLMTVALQFQPVDVVSFLAEYLEAMVDDSLLLSTYCTLDRIPNTNIPATQCAPPYVRDEKVLHAEPNMPDIPRLQLPDNLPDEEPIGWTKMNEPLRPDAPVPPAETLADAFVYDKCSSEMIDQFYNSRFYAVEEAPSYSETSLVYQRSLTMGEGELQASSPSSEIIKDIILNRSASNTSTTFNDQSDMTSDIDQNSILERSPDNENYANQISDRTDHNQSDINKDNILENLSDNKNYANQITDRSDPNQSEVDTNSLIEQPLDNKNYANQISDRSDPNQSEPDKSDQSKIADDIDGGRKDEHESDAENNDDDKKTTAADDFKDRPESVKNIGDDNMQKTTIENKKQDTGTNDAPQVDTAKTTGNNNSDNQKITTGIKDDFKTRGAGTSTDKNRFQDSTKKKKVPTATLR